MRGAAVVRVGAFGWCGIGRESSDKGIGLLLSWPISRTSYYLGKVAGFASCGGLLSGCFALVMLLWSPPLAVAAWFVSLVLEVTLVAIVSLFFVTTLGEVVAALAAVAGTYLLSRVAAAIQSIAVSPVADDSSILQKMASSGIDLVALLLPPLDQATQTGWLLYAPPSAPDFLRLVGSLAVYGVLVLAAGLFAFHRRNL